MIHTGEYGEYRWLVSGSQIWPLSGLVLGSHRRLRLCITSFDSGPLRLADEEVAQGWTTQGDVAISPPVSEGLAVPHDQYDEWYLLDRPTIDTGDIEVFVNYGGFTLVPPAETYQTFDPTGEKARLDWLAPIQERFWRQLDRLKPETFVAMGDNDIVVSRNHRFIQNVREAAEPGAAADPRRQYGSAG
jgi:acetyl esterase/lipase